MTNPNDNVYGVLVTSYDDDGNSKDTIKGGLTKREYFAASVLQGLSVDLSFSGTPEERQNKAVEWSVKLADKLIEELNKEKK
jgi:hypothetical protein